MWIDLLWYSWWLAGLVVHRCSLVAYIWSKPLWVVTPEKWWHLHVCLLAIIVAHWTWFVGDENGPEPAGGGSFRQEHVLYPHWHPWTVGFSSSMLSIYYSHLLYPCLVDSSDHTHDHNYDDKSGDSLPIDMAVRSTSYPTIWRFPEMGVPLFIIYVNGVFHYKPSILGYPSHHPLADFFSMKSTI